MLPARFEHPIQSVMTRTPNDHPGDNRERKLEGRARRRRFVQGTRAYTHALTNSRTKRFAAQSEMREDRKTPSRNRD